MKKDKIAFGMLLFLSVVFFSQNASAFSATFCTTWKANYVDAGYGEDYVSSTGANNWDAMYSHAQLQRKQIVGKGYDTVWSGILDDDGCTPVYISLDPGEKYRFRQGTKLEHIDGRKIYVQHGVAPDYGASWVWLNKYFSTEGLPDTGLVTLNLNPSWNSPQTRVTVVSGRVLDNYDDLEYPAYAKTYVNTNPSFCYGSVSNWENSGICIDTDYLYNDGTSFDHSYYKFVIGHEFGHRQADATNGPVGHIFSVSIYHTDVQNLSPDPCNCFHTNPSDPSDAQPVCLQSRAYTGSAQIEAWAHFYGAALFNDRETGASPTDCHMGFWAGVSPILTITRQLSRSGRAVRA